MNLKGSVTEGSCSINWRPPKVISGAIHQGRHVATITKFTTNSSKLTWTFTTSSQSISPPQCFRTLSLRVLSTHAHGKTFSAFVFLHMRQPHQRQVGITAHELCNNCPKGKPSGPKPNNPLRVTHAPCSGPNTNKALWQGGTCLFILLLGFLHVLRTGCEMRNKCHKNQHMSSACVGVPFILFVRTRPTKLCYERGVETTPPNFE